MNYLKLILRFSFLSIIIFLFTVNHTFSQNLVKNPGFETGVISPPWIIWTGGESSSITIDTNNVYVGEFCAKLTGIKVYLYQPVNLEPNTTYKISATIKTESSDFTYFGISNVWDTTGTSIVFNNTNFKTDSLSFTTDGNSGNNPGIYIWKENGIGSVWVDNVKLIADTTGQIPDETGGLGTYYISLLGDDTNTGTSPDQAWQTIDKVNRINFESGDKILFEGGQTFYGSIRFNCSDSGAVENSVQLGSYGTGRATIDAGTGSGFTAFDCEYLSIKNLNFKGNGRKTGNTGNGINFSFCSNIIVDSVEVSGFQHSGLTARNVGTNYRFTNIYAHNNGYAGIFISGIDKTSLSDIYIGHCIADNNPGDPTVLDNHSGNGIFAFNSRNIIIEYCKASNNGWDMHRTGNGPGGIWVAEVDSALIQYCISHNNTSAGGQDGLGFDLDGGTTNTIIQYCLSYNNYGAGYGIFQYAGASDWKNNTVRYCISENDGNVSAGASILIWNGSGNNDEFQGFEFYNNVIYNANGSAMTFYDHYNSNFNFRNNIFVSEINNVYNEINGENFQGNCWYSLNNDTYSDSVNFTAWAQANNQEMLNGEIVGMFANPMLINPGNSTLTDPTLLQTVDNYKVQENSAVIDAGLDLESLFNIETGTRDYFGNPIKPGMAFDIGVYQNIDRQEISFNQGWNIMSLRVLPDDSNLKNILQPLIDAGKLKKVMDESGKVIEDWGYFGGWKNTIGDLKNTEGYKINITSSATLEVTGIPTQFPFEIPLNAGWNIISWPSPNEQNGKDVFQTLINEGKLKKVMDESGKVIEDWGYFGGWQNNIGNFKPGEGYKVNVTSASTLTVNESGIKSVEIMPELKPSVHFVPEFKGNGIDHMNINLVGLPVNVLQAGDELAIFDGATCVGTVTLMPHHLKNQTVSIVASATDNYGMAGFAEGNPFVLKLWNSRNNQEFILEPEIINGTSTFAKHETTIASLKNYTATGWEGITGSDLTEINCYPNPFSDEVTIEINLKSDAEVEVEVLNQLGQRVKAITTKRNISNGIHRLKWNGKNTANQQVSSGIFYVRIMIGSEIYFKKVVYSKIE